MAAESNASPFVLQELSAFLDEAPHVALLRVRVVIQPVKEHTTADSSCRCAWSFFASLLLVEVLRRGVRRGQLLLLTELGSREHIDHAIV